MVKMKPWPIIALILIVVASVGAAVYYAHEASIVGTPSAETRTTSAATSIILRDYKPLGTASLFQEL